MKIVPYKNIFLSVESADTTIKCYKGVAGNVGGNKQEILSEETCETGVTQCLKYSSGLGINAAKGEGKIQILSSWPFALT